MSDISTIIDAVITRVDTILPSHKRLPFGQVIEQNDTLFLNKGWGLGIASGSNTNRNLSCKLSIQRDLIITITRAVYGNERSTTIKTTVDKNLLEDQFLIIQDLEKDPTLSATLSKINFIGDNGVEDVFGDNLTFKMIQSTFSIEYFENLT